MKVRYIFLTILTVGFLFWYFKFKTPPLPEPQRGDRLVLINTQGNLRVYKDIETKQEVLCLEGYKGLRVGSYYLTCWTTGRTL
jgi:hypothetical protein